MAVLGPALAAQTTDLWSLIGQGAAAAAWRQRTRFPTPAAVTLWAAAGGLLVKASALF